MSTANDPAESPTTTGSSSNTTASSPDSPVPVTGSAGSITGTAGSITGTAVPVTAESQPGSAGILPAANASNTAIFWLPACLISASIEPIIVKLGYSANCTALQLICLKSIVSAILICPLTRQFTWVGKEGFIRILPVALLLLSTGALCLLALQYIKASLLITITTVTPAAVALVNQALGRDILSTKFWIGFALCAGGLFLTTKTEFQNIHILGIALAFGAVASSTTYRVYLEKVTKVYKPALVSTYIFLINGFCLLPLIPSQLTNVTANMLACGLWLGTAAAVANVAFLYAISLLGSTRVSIITMLERPLIIAFAAIILKENLSILQICGIVLVIVGVNLAKVKRKAS